LKFNFETLKKVEASADHPGYFTLQQKATEPNGFFDVNYNIVPEYPCRTNPKQSDETQLWKIIAAAGLPATCEEVINLYYETFYLFFDFIRISSGGGGSLWAKVCESERAKGRKRERANHRGIMILF
jgi:hypothetical protein